MGQITYDIDMLRSFSTGIALGSYARAADRLGRSTSAVSAQLKKLESQSGTTAESHGARRLSKQNWHDAVTGRAIRRREVAVGAPGARRFCRAPAV